MHTAKNYTFMWVVISFSLWAMLIGGCAPKPQRSIAPPEPAPLSQEERRDLAPALPDPRRQNRAHQRERADLLTAPVATAPARTSYIPVSPSEGSVWSVKIVATSRESSSRTAAEEVRKLTGEEVDVVRGSTMWKVLAGRYIDRREAATVRDRLRSLGYPGAWIVERKVSAPATSVVASSRFSVQVFAASMPGAAEQVAREVRAITTSSVEVLNIKSNYKVLVGGSDERSGVERLQSELKEKGYIDAWIYDRRQ